MTRPVFYSGPCDAASNESARHAAFHDFRAILAGYIVGETRLGIVRREMVRFVAASHDRAVSMLHYLRAANESGLLTATAMRILVNDIRAAIDRADHHASTRGGTSHRQPDVEPVAPVPTRQNRLLAGRFEIGERVGMGGIGEVYRARDLRRVEAGHRDSSVAIKIIQRRHSDCPHAIRSLQREAVNAQCLVHPGIRRVYELDRERKLFFLVMEWLDGETFAARLDRTKGRPMAADAFRAVLMQTASALSFAHRHGIVHGDVKPGNLFMTACGDIKLLDFGHTEGITSPARSEPFAITLGYSSTEVSQGAQPEIRDDVYSLSVMLYRMLVGRRPFGRCNAIEAEMRGLQPAPPSMLSARQWQVLQAGLARRRENRVATVVELSNGLLLSPVAPPARPHLVVAA